MSHQAYILYIMQFKRQFVFLMIKYSDETIKGVVTPQKMYSATV